MWVEKPLCAREITLRKLMCSSGFLFLVGVSGSWGPAILEQNATVAATSQRDTQSNSEFGVPSGDSFAIPICNRYIRLIFPIFTYGMFNNFSGRAL